MRFFYAKKTLRCKGCGSEIQRNDVCIRTFLRNKVTGQGYGLVYHYQCYISAFTERIRTQALAWLDKQEKRRPIGRPTIYTNGKEVNRLKGLIRYYKKVGNQEKVQELGARVVENIRDS